MRGQGGVIFLGGKIQLKLGQREIGGHSFMKFPNPIGTIAVSVNSFKP